MDKKIRKIFFVLVFSVFFLLSALTALAEYKLEVGIPGQVGEGSSVGLAEYIRYIYLFALGAVGVAALGALVVGGFMYMFSDLVTTKEEAKKYIQGAILGLLLGLAAYLILYTINPDLIRLNEPNLELPGSEQSSTSGTTETNSDEETNTNQGLPSAEGETSTQLGTWTIIPVNKYCADVLGTGWTSVDGSNCPGSSPGGNYSCCKK